MDLFARLFDQARELWARPVGKWIVGVLALFIIGMAATSFLVTRPVMVSLGTFGAEDAPKVAAQLTERRIPFKQSGTSGFNFNVPDDRLNDARLALAEIQLDPASTVWSISSWSKFSSWSNTDFDKRVNYIERLEENLSRSVQAMSVVERARVTISMETEQKLFASQEKPPKAMVIIEPKKNQRLTPTIVMGVAETVAASVPGLKPQDVTIMDASTSRVVSADLFKPKDSAAAQAEQRLDLLSIQQQVQDSMQDNLTRQLERVIGAGKVAVMVTPVINWDRVMQESIAYKGAGANGQGVVLSSQRQRESTEGAAGSSSVLPSGTTSNSEPTSPTYPGGMASGGGGATSAERSNEIFNYLVDQLKTTTERPSGAVEALSVGVLVDSKVVLNADMEQRLRNVVIGAMGPRATVSVEAFPFNDELLKLLEPPARTPVAAAPNWLFWVLGIALGLGGVGFFFVATRPKRPVLEPVFAGPESAMLGGIPVTEWEMPAQPTQSAAVDIPEPTQVAAARQYDKARAQTAEEILSLPPEDLAKMTDEELTKMGVDPATVRMKEKVSRIAKVEPESVANLLRTWMHQE